MWCLQGGLSTPFVKKIITQRDQFESIDWDKQIVKTLFLFTVYEYMYTVTSLVSINESYT